jgi:hypothetical protein
LFVTITFFFLSGVLFDKDVPGIGKSLFFHENGRSSNFFHRANFKPEFNIQPEIPENV